MSKRNHKPSLPPYTFDDGGGHQHYMNTKRALERLRKMGNNPSRTKPEDPANAYWEWWFRNLPKR